MAKETFSRETYVHVQRAAQAQGGTTKAAEERHRRGEGPDPLVDPKGYGVTRRSLPRFEEVDGKLVLSMGIPMHKRTRLDTTGSMGVNVDRAFVALPKSYDLLAGGRKPVLGRYDVQIGTDIFGDLRDNFVLLRSQFEMGEKIAKQLTLMPPERGGYGNGGEDPQYGLFGAAYLTQSSITERWGLKGYDFTLSDEPGRAHLERQSLVRVFGDEVMDRVAENGHKLGSRLPSTEQVVKDLSKIAHAFFLEVPGDSRTHEFWLETFGRDRLVVMPSVDHLPYVEAAIIGLTEGVLSLQTVGEFLREEGELPKGDADAIVRAVSGIPIGAQAKLPGFADIPKRGDVFAEKTDSWPIGHPKGPKGAAKPKGAAEKKEKAGAWL